MLQDFTPEPDTDVHVGAQPMLSKGECENCVPAFAPKSKYAFITFLLPRKKVTVKTGEEEGEGGELPWESYLKKRRHWKKMH